MCKLKILNVLLIGLALGLSQAAYGYVELLLDPNKVGDFKDLSLHGRDGPKVNQKFSEEMVEHLQRLLDKHLPPDSTLSIVITEVDMAGEYEFWRPPPEDTIRIMKDIYSPRIEFSYVLTGDDGAVLKKGEVVLTDSYYLQNLRTLRSQSDPLYYEKELIRDWVLNDLRRFYKKD